MDSTGTIQFFLILLTIITVAGFTGITYYLAELSRAIKGQGSPPQVSVTPGTPPRGPDLAEPVSTPPSKPIEPAKMGSLEETLGAISEKYSLASLTLATADGLLIGSTKSGSEDEAARYSHLYAQEDCTTRKERNSLVFPTAERRWSASPTHRGISPVNRRTHSSTISGKPCSTGCKSGKIKTASDHHGKSIHDCVR